ncbi:synaptogenesis protein syg-1-like [Branchiostoma floridae x Branchiostoma belcheri]
MTFMTLRMTLLLAVLAPAVEGQQQARYTEVPRDTTVVEGENVTLNCSVENITNDTSVKWFGPPNYHFRTEGRNSGHPRYTIVGDPSEDEFNLHITDVGKADGGQFRCWVREVRGDPAEATLTVKDRVTSAVSNVHAFSSKFFIILQCFVLKLL